MTRKSFHGLVMLTLLGSLVPLGAAALQPQAPVGVAPQPAVKPADQTSAAGVRPEGTPGQALEVSGRAVALDYGWSQSSGTYTEIAGGTQLTASCDDTSYPNNPLPFTFTFDGNAYTAVSVNCNGFLAMGAAVASSYLPISGGSSNNVVAALGGDQQTNAADSEIRYETLGSAPDRVFVVQWKNFRHYGAAGDSYNYQIRLHETSNLVEVVYGAFAQNATARTAEVGLRGASNADFNNRSGTGAWTASTAGGANTATMALTSTAVPPTGLTWAWSPLAPHPTFDSSSKTAPAQVVMGDPIAYTVQIVNSGSAEAAAATMVDVIPAGSTYNGDVACTSGTCGFAGGNVTWSGTVPAGGDVTVTFSVDTDGLACGSVVNQATLDDPGLSGGAVVRSATTGLVSSTPTALEGFEVIVPPAGWTETVIFDPGTDPDWTRETAGTYPTIAPHGGSAMAKFNSFSTGAGGSARLASGALDLSGFAAPAVVFWMSHDTGYSSNADRVQVQVSADGVTWVDAGGPVLRYDAAFATPGWKEHVVRLPAGYNVNGTQVAFLGISAYGNNFFLDDTALVEAWYPCPYVSLAADDAQTSCPGSTVGYTLTLDNVTPDSDAFDLGVAGNAWPTTPSPAQLVLGPGASGQVVVSVDLPAAPGSDAAVVTALGQAFGGTGSATLTTTAADAFWTQVPSEPDSGRMDNVLGAWGGQVWSITGYGANANVRRYDPATETWTSVGTPPSFGNNYARSGCQAGSAVYVYGDAATGTFTGLWSYDMATTSWAQETPAGTAPATPGIWAPAWAHDAETGLCYLTGGATAAGPGTLSTVHVYDPALDAWLAPLPGFTTVRDFHAAWVFTDGAARKLLCVAGGTNAGGDLTSTQCYDFGTGTWGAENADIGVLPASLLGMGYAQAEHGGSTELWVVGGVRAGTVSAATSFFDVAAGAWADGGNLVSGAVFRTGAVTLDNEVFKLGGSVSSFNYTGLADRRVQCVATPNADVSPASLSSSQAPNTTTQQVLAIANTGTAALGWSVAEHSSVASCSSPADVPWLSEVPVSGTVPAGGTQDVTVTFDSTGLAVGTYQATLCVASDDPDPGPGNGTDLVVVPVTLEVPIPVELTSFTVE